MRLDPAALPRRVGLHLPSTLPLTDWTRIGRQLSLITDSSVWWLGDWLVHGETSYPGLYKKAVAETALDYQTLRNYAWVTRKFPMARRRVSLSFQHHAEVASLTPAEQDRWLDQAERHRWSRNELRRRVRAYHRRDSTAATRTSVVLRVPSQQEARWRQAADQAGIDLIEWMALALNQAAEAIDPDADPGADLDRDSDPDLDADPGPAVGIEPVRIPPVRTEPVRRAGMAS
jgi:hypothetical protein